MNWRDKNVFPYIILPIHKCRRDSEFRKLSMDAKTSDWKFDDWTVTCITLRYLPAKEVQGGKQERTYGWRTLSDVHKESPLIWWKIDKLALCASGKDALRAPHLFHGFPAPPEGITWILIMEKYQKNSDWEAFSKITGLYFFK